MNRRWDISFPAACPEYIQTTNYTLHIVHAIFHQIAFFFLTSWLKVVQWWLAQPSKSQISYVAWLQSFWLTGSWLWLRVSSELELQQHYPRVNVTTNKISEFGKTYRWGTFFVPFNMILMMSGVLCNSIADCSWVVGIWWWQDHTLVEP